MSISHLPSKPNPQRSTTHRSGFLGNVVVFSLGAVSFVEFPVVGRLFATEIILAATILLLIAKRESILKRPLTKTFLSLALVWFIGQFATDIIRDSELVDFTKGLAKIVFTVVNLLGLYFLLDRRSVRYLLYLFGLATGQFIGYVVNPNPNIGSDPWKWGLGWPATFAIVAIAHIAYRRGHRLLSIGFLSTIACVHLIMGFRSLALVCFIAASVVFYFGLKMGTAGYRQRLGGVVLVCVLAPLAFQQAYGYLARSGTLGESALRKYENQSSGEYGLLLGGRSESLTSLLAIADSPIIGYGSAPRDQRYVDMLFESQLRHGYRNVRPREDDVIPSHSHIIGAWIEAGILGVPFWAWVVILLARCLRSAILRPTADLALIVFACTLLAWEIPFSPYSADLRFIDTFFLLVTMTYMEGNSALKISSRRRSLSNCIRPLTLRGGAVDPHGVRVFTSNHPVTNRSVTLLARAYPMSSIGALLLFCASAGCGQQIGEISKEHLDGETLGSSTGTYTVGNRVWLKFSATNIPQTSKKLSLSLKYCREEGDEGYRREYPVNPSTTGYWEQTVEATPDSSAPLGFYRVLAQLSDGTRLSPKGSRGAGYLTFAVVMRPTARRDYGAPGSRFGMQGGFSPSTAELLELLGVRYVLGPYDWTRNEPRHQGQFFEKWGLASEQNVEPALRIEPYLARIHANRGWRVYLLPVLSNATIPDWARDSSTSGSICKSFGALNEAGEAGWAKFTASVAATYARWHADEPIHPYQITWEPGARWCFKGTSHQLVKYYEIAYRQIHSVDNKAVILGPTLFPDLTKENMNQMLELWSAGLGRYIDGFSMHPYFKYPPETHGFIEALRKQVALAKEASGRNLPLYGTERGYQSSGVPDEIDQARGNMRQTIILLGEGAVLDIGFYISDYFEKPLGGYGYYYNLNPTIKFGTDRVAPKPTAPALATLSYLLDGSQPEGQIQGLGHDSLAYSFTRDGQRTIAIWNYGPTQTREQIRTETPGATVFDWMGNSHHIETDKGSLNILAQQNPQYIVYDLNAKTVTAKAR